MKNDCIDQYLKFQVANELHECLWVLLRFSDRTVI